MKEKNQINEIENNEIHKNENIINNKKSDLDNNEKINYFFQKDIYNTKGTKIKEKEKFIKLMNILHQYIQEKNDFFFLYFKQENLDLIKILFNGYITSDIQNLQEKENFLSTIKIIANTFFSNNLFYIVYNKLSKIFRKFNSVENKEILFDKFYKTFDLWNLIFSLNNKIELNSNYISLIGNQTLILSIKSKKFHFDCVEIFIEFDEGINKLNNDFSFVNVQYVKVGLLNLKNSGIFKEKNKENIHNISIRIDRSTIGYLFNDTLDEDKNDDNKYNKIIDFKNDDNFEKLEILKNYKGKIKLINIKIKLIEDKSLCMEYEVIPSLNTQGYEIFTNQEKKEFINLSFDNKILYSQIYNEKLFEDIRYYGGFECFIPIIKIIKYFMAFYKDNNDKINILNDMLIKIMIKIIQLVCYSRCNFDNLKNILTSVLAAFAEINHVYPDNLKNNFYSHYTFTLLYILIMNSTFCFSLKKYYTFITGLDNINKLNLNFEEFPIDANWLNITSYGWYIIMIINIMEFILLTFGNKSLISKKLIEQLLSLQKLISAKSESLLPLINCSMQIMNNICTSETPETQEKEENNLFDNIPKIENLPKYLQKNIINNEQNLTLVINMMKAYFNLNNYDSFWKGFDDRNSDIKELNINKKEKEKNFYKNNFKNVFNAFETLLKEKNEKNEKIRNFISKTFKSFYYNQEYLKKIFPFLSEKDEFILESAVYISEFVDFKKSYHNLMKNIFIFNKLWSDKKLFFNEEKREKYLKYKSINYYTTNYQRPFIFPHLDYKLSYPKFTQFELKKDFYIEEENPDEYNFNLDCPELEELNIKYEEYLLSKIHNKMNIYNVCLIKTTHHIKGRLIICNDNSSKIKKILFISFPSNIAKNTPCCNVHSKILHYNKNNENLCFGAIFVCPEKDMNTKIVLNIKDIRMILKRIYFYRKSAVEIFTLNKSYFFNFTDYKDDSSKCEAICDSFTNFFGFFIPDFVPVVISETIIGYSRQFQNFMESYINDEKNYATKALEGNKFIRALFGHWIKERKGISLSTLDLLTYLNLLSNRSYNDLFQYPVFPLFFIYDKTQGNNFKRLERKLNLHIGFQEVSEKAKQRKQLINKSFNDEMKDLNEEAEEVDEETPLESPSYFQTHFSTNIYTSGFLMRVFPYSFLCIELQGSGFDTPNRLFFGIEQSFYNISCTKSDLRELVPEFYYFPEMFLNINKINFHKRANNIQVNNVIMPHDICHIGKDKDKNSISYENSDYFKSFKFVEELRNLLESKKVDILSWINIIFGTGQKYKNSRKKDLLFREQSYIDYTKDKDIDFINYRQDKNYMTSAEFGITPIQTIFEGDLDFVQIKNRYNYYDMNSKEVRHLFSDKCKIFTEQIQKKEPKSKDKNDKKPKDINKDDQNIKRNCKKFLYNPTFKISNNNNEDKMKEVKYKKNGKNKINGYFSNNKSYINSIFQCDMIEISGYKTGKVKLNLKNEENNYEFYDHSDEIVSISYNKSLNMMCTTSIDGLLNIYILPNKLITTIKNSNNNYFMFAFLCSYPFPEIIAIENESYEISSYTINGFKIKKVKLKDIIELDTEKKEYWLLPYFDFKLDNKRDRLICIEKKSQEKESTYNCYLIKVPFFELEETIKDIKYK